MSNMNISKILKRHSSKELPTNRDLQDLADVLCLTAKRGDVMGVIKVLDSGASANAANRMGVLPMWAAVDSDAANIQVIRYLLSRGADVQIRNKNGESLLRVAGLRGRLDVVKILTDAGADLMEDSDDGEAEGEGERSNVGVMYTVVRDLDAPSQKKEPMSQC
ncbi:myotrophin-like [Branchiostoma lanceolatum]|uniref:myotrophin-like n=1 Tax=Branchiostoma lanceolatum TaxID=7740 RepID=UPI003455B096